MSSPVRASVVINNYNYGQFVGAAIESALAQTYQSTEVVVVDDGSEDQSRGVIRAYGERVVPVFKRNGGQASALNAGFSASAGEVIIFLDADDTLAPAAVETAVSLIMSTDAVKAHWPLAAVDVRGVHTGMVLCANPPAGDFRAAVREHGLAAVTSPPTSGNAWSRPFLERVMPIPEKQLRLCADAYLFTAAAALGPIAASEKHQSYYRLHGNNRYWGYLSEQKLQGEIARCDLLCEFLRQFLNASHDDVQRWRTRSLYQRLGRAVEEITAVTPLHSTVVLIDADEWALTPNFAGRSWLPFCERDGFFWGMPADSAAAIRELERLRRRGAGFAVIAWTAFWAFEQYREFHEHLLARYPQVRANDEVIVFDLRR